MFGKKPSSKSGFSFKGVEKDGFSSREIFTAKLDAQGIKYSLHDEKPIVYLNYKGDNFESLTFTFIFDDDGASIAIRVYSIAKFDDDQIVDAYEFCNKMNAEYRWLRFYVDSDNEFTAAVDAVVGTDTLADECYELLARSVNIVDDVYAKLHE